MVNLIQNPNCLTFSCKIIPQCPSPITTPSKNLYSFLSTPYLSSIAEYKRLFSSLDTTSLIPSLNYFVNKVHDKNNHIKDMSDILDKMNVHLFQLESYNFYPSDKIIKVDEVCERKLIKSLILNSSHEYSHLKGISSSVPNLLKPDKLSDKKSSKSKLKITYSTSSSNNCDDSYNSKNLKKLVHIQSHLQSINVQTRYSKNHQSQVREFKLSDKFKFQFRTNNSFWNLVKQFVICNSRYHVDKVITSQKTSIVNNPMSSLAKERSKSLDCLITKNNSKKNKPHNHKKSKKESKIYSTERKKEVERNLDKKEKIHKKITEN